MQPVAVYVPASYVPGKAAPLIVFLHGNPQSESQLLAPRFVRELAEANGTILVAPYGRGYYDFRGTKEDVYDALDAAEKAFTVDPRKRFLVGYSMGGFSVFEVAPDRPNTWTAVMCISGALLGSDAPRVLAFMPSTPFYVLTGLKDESIPTQYPTVTASYLSQQGIPVSFYSLPDGIHRLISLLPILTPGLVRHGARRRPVGAAGARQCHAPDPSPGRRDEDLAARPRLCRGHPRRIASNRGWNPPWRNQCTTCASRWLPLCLLQRHWVRARSPRSRRTTRSTLRHPGRL